MYEFGKGALHDYIQALMWYNVSIAQGNSVATKNRDRVASKMTSEQIAQSQKLAKEWVAQQYLQQGRNPEDL
jgi:TPR repeat protein